MSTVREEEKGAALRFNSGKRQWSLVDWPSIEPMVEVLEFGAEKYAPDNWKKGLEIRGVMESMLRHAFAFLEGEDRDQESGLSHIGHIMCNAMFVEYYMKHYPGLDNRLKFNPIAHDIQMDPADEQ